MRTIKFRGYIPPYLTMKGRWVYGLLVHYNVETATIVNNEELYVAPSNTIGQFTGLYDKNGMEIYEGDIVHLYYYRQNDLGETLWFHRNVLVKWSDDDTFYGIGGWDGDDYFDIATRYRHSIQEVIGNIHDKEELK